MNDQLLLERITLNTNVMAGKPVIKGTRLTVEFILNLLAHGTTTGEILAEYDGLEPEDIQACLLFAMLVRVRQFGTDNAGDFPGGSIGDAQFTVVRTSVDGVESEAGKQQAGFGEASQQFEVKGTARENLREQMSDIARTARSMEYAFDGIVDKFRFPVSCLKGTNAIGSGESRRNGSMLDRVPERDKLIEMDNVSLTGTNLALRSYRRVLPDSIEYVPFRDATDAFEAAFSTTASATAEHVEATAKTGESIRLGMVAVRILDGVVKNKYANDVGKLAAWTSASHVEKAPTKKPTPTP